MKMAGYKKKINYQALYDYFKYLYIPDPKTIYENIHKLEPGHCMTCTQQGIQKKEYWDVSFGSPMAASLNETAEELYTILDESVKLRMISDVPLGAFLSGGIDSSCVVAMMAHQSRAPVTTCSIGFDSEKYDEVRFAKIVADLFQTDHHEMIVRDNAPSIISKLSGYFDEPFADSSAVPTWFVSKLARRKVTVALSGDGGDENFAGYEKYYLDDIENRIRSRIPEAIRRPLFPVMSGLFSRFDHSLCQKAKTLLHTLGHDSAYGFYLTNTEMTDDLWDALINRDTQRAVGDYNPFSVTEKYYNKADTDNHLSKILYTDLKTYLPGDILVKVDRMSMAHSLEVRAPILDHRVIEFAASIPHHLKYHRGDKKYILKHALKRKLPDSILYRKKMGFSVPLADWFRNEIRNDARQVLLSENSELADFFHMRTIQDVWEAHQSGRRNCGAVLWSLYMFGLWYNWLK